MKNTLISTLVAALVLTTALSAKGVTTRITIKDTGRTSSIAITEPAILEQFNVWAGPGTFVNRVEQTQGFVIDWPAGAIADRPSGLQQYEVSFYVRSRTSTDDQLTYVVLYEHDPSLGQGFVYLPGRSDERYALNTRAIFRGHGYEGNWFRATSAWQKAVAGLLPGR